MGKKTIVAEPVSGGPHEQLYKLLVENEQITARQEEITGQVTEIAQMLCTEANMTENTKGKSLWFAIQGTQDVIKVNRMDRLKIIDQGVELAIQAAKMKYEASIKPFKDEFDSRKKLIEVKAQKEGRAKKMPSYYAHIAQADLLVESVENKEE